MKDFAQLLESLRCICEGQPSSYAGHHVIVKDGVVYFSSPAIAGKLKFTDDDVYTLDEFYNLYQEKVKEAADEAGVSPGDISRSGIRSKFDDWLERISTNPDESVRSFNLDREIANAAKEASLHIAVKKVRSKSEPPYGEREFPRDLL